MTYEQATAYLFSLESRGIKLDLDRVRACLEDLGRPQDAFPSILVAGTNGKGSTATALASALSRPGRRVGLYTSPHLLDFRERIRLDGRLVSPETIVARVAEDRPVWERFQLSFFEAATALAFSVFSEAALDLAILEVGLGGRLDATNTVEPILSVITSLGMDHAAILGDTPAAIAREKAGILRLGIPAVVARGHRSAIDEVRSRALTLRAPFYLLRECLWVDRLDPGSRGSRFRVRPRPGSPDGFAVPASGLNLTTPLSGRHQVQNAALAVLALTVLRERGWSISDAEITRGIARLSWPARTERPLPGLPLIADVAHNREGARALADWLRDLAGRREIRIVAGMVSQKDHAGFFRELSRISRRAWVAEPSTPRAAPREALAHAARAAGFEVQACPDVATALQQALEGAQEPDGPLVLLCGSFYTLEAGYRYLGIGPKSALWESEPSSRSARSVASSPERPNR